MRRRSALRVLQRRAVTKTNEGEELIQLTVAVNGQHLPAQRIERDRVLRDDWSEDNAHAAILTSSRAGACIRHLCRQPGRRFRVASGPLLHKCPNRVDDAERSMAKQA